MTKYVYADSTNRDSTLYPSGNSYTLHLTTPVQLVTQVDLIAALIPNTMYNLNNGSNVVTFNGTNISIPPGYYSAYGLGQALANSSGFLFCVDFSESEGKFIFSSDVSSFTFQANTSEMQRMLGLDSGSYSSFSGSTDSVYGRDLTYSTRSLLKSIRVVNLSVNEYVFLDIDELRSTDMIDSKSLVNETFSGLTIRSTFGMIPMDVTSGTFKTFKESTDYKLSIKFDTPLSKISRLTIRILDKTGVPVNFQGFESNAFLLRFHVLEPKEPEPEPLPSITKLEVQRMLETIKPPSAPTKKSGGVPRYALYFVILLLIGGLYFAVTAYTGAAG